jgi:hypothetical protein
VARNPRVVILALCDEVLCRPDNADVVSLINVFESYFVTQFPFRIPKLWLVAKYQGGQGPHELHCEVHDTDANVLWRSRESTQFFENETSVHRTLQCLFGLTIEGPGFFWLRAYVDGKEVQCVPFSVNRMENLPDHTG